MDDDAAAMENDTVGALRGRRVERATDNTLARGSSQSYTGSVMRYLSWLYTTGETLLGKELLSPAFRNGVVGHEPTRAYMKAFLAQKPRVAPLVFSAFTGSDFILWLASLQDEAERRTGKSLTPSTMSGHRSALRFLFSENQLELDDFTDKTYEEFFSGLRSDTTGVHDAGAGTARAEKLPLPFQAYGALCGCLLASGNAEDVFAHCFLTLQWNLVCRSNSAASICFSHITWRDGAMGIVLPRMNDHDQAGERPRDPRPVFANPKEPTVCPVLSLAMYFLCFPFISGQRIFPGDNQPERFRKRLHAVLSGPSLSALLEEIGISPSDIGTDSIWKGSTTYSSSGPTARPPSSAVRVAGWSTGAVHERYCQCQSAGDQHVGQTAFRPPVDTRDVAAPYPHFATIDAVVVAATKGVFPALHQVAPTLASFCLASLVHHDNFLTQTLPPDHPVRQSQYFKDATLKQSLVPLVSLSSGTGETLRPTGVPQQVNLIAHMNTFAGELRELVAAVRAMPDAIAATISARTAHVDGPVMRSELRGLVQAIEQVNRRLDALQSQPPSTQQPPQEDHPVTTVRLERGRLVREEFAAPLPKVSLMTAWQLWFVGPPPLRFATPNEMRSNDDRKRLSDLAFVMKKINERVPGFPANRRPTLHEANDAFLDAVKNFELLSKTPQGRSRRAEQIRWTTAATILRTQQARPPQTTIGHN